MGTGKIKMGRLPDKNLTTNSFVLILIDAGISFLSTVITVYVCRSTASSPIEPDKYSLTIGILLPLIFVPSSWWNGVYESEWQRALDSLLRISKSILLALIVITALYKFIMNEHVPFYVFFLNIAILTILVISAHYCFRLYYVWKYPDISEDRTSCEKAKVYSLSEVLKRDIGTNLCANDLRSDTLKASGDNR